MKILKTFQNDQKNTEKGSKNLINTFLCNKSEYQPSISFSTSDGVRGLSLGDWRFVSPMLLCCMVWSNWSNSCALGSLMMINKNIDFNVSPKSSWNQNL